ncbi:hypothetical protein CcrC1_gp307 [Caulobacter phage C1]|nr:hypothetical protein CcrC1_gp307 [Caulobacter phage C1]UTU08536.1 hypothetical protein CcrC2_gp308 [Caulobacter phage C2]UTU09052.1 hypothetical protein CcrJ4_gp303 [Caulobacter phage J4]UTU10169.1 hypothetical protein CcrRB23_gp307 [Caulobacter phage RB23]WGN97203.1 hypothetical protein [Bertelyvirus sp.]
MRRSLHKTVTLFGRQFGLIQAYSKAHDHSILHGKSTIDRSACLRVLGLGVVLQSHQSTKSWCVALGHEWLFDIQLSGTFAGAPKPPPNPFVKDAHRAYEPHIGLCLILLGSVSKALWAWDGFDATSVLAPGSGRVMRWSHRFG